MAVVTDCEPLAPQVDVLRSIFESLPTGILVANAQGRLLFANPAAERILNTNTHRDSPGLPDSVCGWYDPDQVTMLPADRLPMERAVRGEVVVEELVFVRGMEPCEGLWLRVSGWPLTDTAGELSGGVVTFRDFTQARETLHMLQLLSRVVVQTGDSVVITDTEGRIRYVNPAFETTSGYTREEAMGATPRILKSGLHDAEFYRQIWTRLKDGQPSRGMVINRRKTGELYWSQQTILPMRDEADRLTHFVSVSRDITDLKKKEEQEFQLQLARDVQRRFYAPPPTVPGLDIGATSHPVYETGGDYFDFITMADGSIVIAVGDVSGHGYGSALMMALTRAYLRSFVSMHLQVHEILARVNDMLLTDLEQEQFVTLCLVRLQPQTGKLSYANAGHVPGFVFRSSGELKQVLDSTGPPLGLFAESAFLSRETIHLLPGEMLALTTDGIPEATSRDGDQFGSQRVLDYVRAHASEPAAQIANGVYQAARSHAEQDPQDDDITALVIKMEEVIS
jgi:phosphoserine phosphatase RsbU/P